MQRAEADGIDGYFSYDHPQSRADCWTALSALAASTSTIRLGTAVDCIYYRSPYMLARQAADVDRLSNGRLVLGLGMGTCFASIYDVAIGDIAGPEDGSASGSLSAVQQLASAIGSAVVTTVYFNQLAGHGAGHAMTVSVAVVAAITALGLGLVWLLPRKAPAEQW